MDKTNENHHKHTDIVWKHIAHNAYDAYSNPKGVINLGIAENRLMTDVISERLSREDVLAHDCSTHRYFPHSGLDSFRSAMATFLQDSFCPSQQLKKEWVVAISGANTALESLAFHIAKPGDCFLIPAPYYSGIEHYAAARAGIRYRGVSMTAQGGVRRLMQDNLEKAYGSGVSEGCNVRALLLVNPSNPYGHLYSEGELEVAMAFCDKHDLHLIVDEIFALSIHDPDATFTSILSLRHLRPDMTHFVWSFSKDFGLGGFRAGVLCTKSDEILQHLFNVGCSFSCVPPLIQLKLMCLVSDTDWLKTEYLPVYRSRLRTAYLKCRDALRDMGVVVKDSPATLFLLAGFSQVMGEMSDNALKRRLMQAGVYCHSMTMGEPGWLRVVFSVPPAQLDEALTRFRAALKSPDSANE